MGPAQPIRALNVALLLAAAPLLALGIRPSASTGQSALAAAEQQPATHRNEESSSLVTSLPGYEGELPVELHGGYITVDRRHGRQLYYLFAVSQSQPAKDPVVLWLNGGPGCSSFDGFVNEHGPFLMSFRGGKDPEGRERQELQLADNPHSWNRNASMLYVDSPAGVGMSYSKTRADYHTNDTQTAADMNTFLRGWFRQYPQYQDNDFYVAGESFGGVYVPMVTHAVLQGNRRGEEPEIRLKGYVIGNGVTDPRFDGNALVPFAVGQSLISTHLHHKVKHSCGGEYWNVRRGSECDRLLDDVYHAVDGINIYNILAGCYHGQNPYHAAAATSRDPAAGTSAPADNVADLRSVIGAALATHRGWPLLGGLTQTGPVPGFGQALLGAAAAASSGPGAAGLQGQQALAAAAAAGQLGHTPPCLDSREMWAFCNSPGVREAIHAKAIEEIGPFRECVNGEVIHYTHDVPSMLPIHSSLMDHGLRALIYSGDHDMAVPHTGSEAWTTAFAAEQGMEQLHSWAPWYIADRQVAGYAVHWRKHKAELTYATIKGAGHMVPQDKPAEAAHMFERFLSGGSLHLHDDA